jgi:hypothetical protein
VPLRRRRSRHSSANQPRGSAPLKSRATCCQRQGCSHQKPSSKSRPHDRTGL